MAHLAHVHTTSDFINETTCDKLNRTSQLPVSDSDIVYAVFYMTGIVTISVICLIGNVLIIRALLTSRQLRGAHNWFVMSLACSDIMQGVTIPFYTLGHSVKVEILQSLDEWKNCQWLIFMVTAPQTISALNLVALTLIRYIAIKNPFEFKEKYNKHRSLVAFAIVGCWLFGFFTAAVLYLLPNVEGKYCAGILGSCKTEIIYDTWNIVVFACINVIIPVLVMLILYCRAISSLKKQRKYLQTFSKSHALVNNSKMIKIVAFLLGYYTFTWTPFLIYEGVSLASSVYSDHRYIRAITRILYFSNVAVNVFVYTGRVKAFREAFKKDLTKIRKYCCCCCKDIICCEDCCKCCQRTDSSSESCIIHESPKAGCKYCNISTISNGKYIYTNGALVDDRDRNNSISSVTSATCQTSETSKI